MALRIMKWHIFNSNGDPLCWDQKAVEFDLEDQARRFLNSHCDGMDVLLDDYMKAFGVSIKRGVFYYDGGHLDCSNKIVVYDDDFEGRLIDAI